uniref:Uncharacterized protein n=1 Tax=Haptolina ericina TaxID=156174 RepID=A0A7S3C2M4_9EUKA|mmetsp:Transcript_7658/g.17135  ORF Transcript_7658/g.17135 Transcript_7658/m.17135 type:complete len:135 (+) Transcript_7658:895-1299(+)
MLAAVSAPGIAAMDGPGAASDPAQGTTGLVEHWLAVEESIQTDARRMRARRSPHSFVVLNLEQLAVRPRDTLVSLMGWLGLGGTLSEAQEAAGIQTFGTRILPGSRISGAIHIFLHALQSPWILKEFVWIPRSR